MSCCCVDPVEPCDPVQVTATCSIQQGSLNDSELAAVCGAGGGGTPQITMTEVGTTVSGDGVLCPDPFITPPSDTVTVNVSGLQPGCVLFAHVAWAETSNDISGCNSGLGSQVVAQSSTGPIGGGSLVHLTEGYDFFVTSMGEAVWWFPVTGSGSGSITFNWPTAFGSPLAGQSQIQVFQVCGDIDPNNPVSGFVVSGIDVPANHPEGTMVGPETITLPAGDCPGIYLASSRHSDYVGNPEGQPNGGFHVVGGTEVSEYVAVQATTFCQIGQVGGLVDGDSFDAYSAMNVTNFYGDIIWQSVWTGIRLNCTTPPVGGGEQIVRECCATVVNDECNDPLQASVDVALPVTISEAGGSDFLVELIYQGNVVDQTTGSGTLTHSTVTGPIAPGAPSPEQCYQVNVVCTAYTAGANQVSWGNATVTVEVTP